MKKIVCIPDSYKGTLSSITVCEVMKKVIHHHFPMCDVITIPVADGGEGSVDAFLSAMPGEKVFTQVHNPYFEKMNAFYGRFDDHLAVIEMAAAAGLPLVSDRPNPSLTSTYGVGELILDAIEHGARHIIVGLGGSATNDAGCGAACALGVKFFNQEGETFIPVGATLKDIVRIDTSMADERLEGISITTMCDIDNPLYGIHGAAHIFSPQKGATPSMVLELDEGLKHVAAMIETWCHVDVSTLSGGGAAGGMGAGMVAFFKSTLQMGIETILDVVKFDELIQGADCIFTGEGKIDSQTLRGKVPVGVGRRALKQHIPVIAMVGAIGEGIDEVYHQGISAIFSINPQPVDFSVAKNHAYENLQLSMDNVIRTLKTFNQ
ncbi:MAG: glycerate kinase [Erysipelotrichaceae bacterium]|nr:glycerate kinase [Erysipelotrichaceae bacterium]